MNYIKIDLFRNISSNFYHKLRTTDILGSKLVDARVRANHRISEAYKAGTFRYHHYWENKYWLNVCQKLQILIMIHSKLGYLLVSYRKYTISDVKNRPWPIAFFSISFLVVVNQSKLSSILTIWSPQRIFCAKSTDILY